MRIFSALFGLLSYLCFLVVFVGLMAFVGDFGLPKSVSRGSVALSIDPLAVNLLLILCWGVQHSVMARDSFKGLMARWLPEYLERSVYVLISALTLLLLMWLWQPQTEVIWYFNDQAVVWTLWGMFFSGWGLALYSTFLTSHIDLFGLRQCYLYLTGNPYTPVPFEEKSVYRFVRHPMMLGILIAFWATPYMTLSHLVFSISMTVYVIVGIYFEEKSLITKLGSTYIEYRLRTWKIIPWVY